MGPSPLRAAGETLRYWELRQNVAANNLANAETPGFKAERAFAHLLGPGQAPEMGAVTDLTAGALRPTGNPLDIALTDERHFLVIETPAGERLIRGGALRLDEQGRLVEPAGRALLGEKGTAILVPPGASVTIDGDGTVRADEKVIDRLRVDAIADPADIEHEAGGIFRAVGTRASVAAEDRGVRQGFIEESNTDTLSSMIDMITIQRAYGAVQGSLRTIDGVMDRIANDIGRVG